MKHVLTLVRSLGVLIGVWAALFAVGTALALTELVTNGNFNSNFTVGTWDQVLDSGVGTYTTTVGKIANGSAWVVAGSGGIGALDQCVPFTATVDSYVSLGGWALLDTDVTWAYISALTYTDNACQENEGNIGNTQFLFSSGSNWQETTTGTGPVSALEVPAGTHSLHIRLVVVASDGFGAYFDDVTAYPSTATAVTLRDFSAQAQSPAAWLWPVAVLVVLSGAWVVSRRRRA